MRMRAGARAPLRIARDPSDQTSGRISVTISLAPPPIVTIPSDGFNRKRGCPTLPGLKSRIAP
jgi:hypothetical protein